jgi:hypothetical protein
VSDDDFRIIRDNLAGGKRSTRDRLVPYCVFTDPPLAHVGLSEGEAQRQGVAARVARLPMKGVLRTATTDETQGFMKVLVGASDDRILGFTMIGAEAREVMTVVQTAMLADLPYPRLRDAVIAHPTMAEGLRPLFSNVPAPIGLARDQATRSEGFTNKVIEVYCWANGHKITMFWRRWAFPTASIMSTPTRAARCGEGGVPKRGDE